jgi:polyisoprenoid-binding protein YceI
MAQALWAGEELELPSPGAWKVDPAHSGVTFSTRYMMLSKIRGRFRHFDAVIFIAESPEDSRVEVAIQAASIDTDHEERDEHLRSPDFLQVDLFPWLSFHSTQVSQVGATSLQVRGDLTIRDITRPVALDVEFLGVTSDPSGSTGRPSWAGPGSTARTGASSGTSPSIPAASWPASGSRSRSRSRH